MSCENCKTSVSKRFCVETRVPKFMCVAMSARVYIDDLLLNLEMYFRISSNILRIKENFVSTYYAMEYKIEMPNLCV